MASLTEHEDMTVVAISLDHAGAFCSIGNVTSRASSSMDRCLLALHGAQVLARAFALLGMVMHSMLFDLIVVAAVFSGDVTDWTETRLRGFWRGGVGLQPGCNAWNCSADCIIHMFALSCVAMS